MSAEKNKIQVGDLARLNLYYGGYKLVRIDGFEQCQDNPALPLYNKYQIATQDSKVDIEWTEDSGWTLDEYITPLTGWYLDVEIERTQMFLRELTRMRDENKESKTPVLEKA